MPSTSSPTLQPIVPPPPGQISNFDNPVTLETAMDVTNGVLVGLSTCMAYLRLGSICFYKRPFGWDDGTFFTAFILGLARLFSVFNSNTIFSHSWDTPKSKTYPPSARKVGYSGTLITETALYVSKISLLLLYLRIFSVQRPTRWVIYLAMFYATIVWAFITVANAVLRAPPIGKSWEAKNLTRVKTVQPIINVIYGFLVLVLDVTIFVIPICASWNIRVSFKWKIKVMAIFCTAFLAVLAATLSAYIRTSNNYNGDRQWAGGLIVICTSIELYISLSISCVPAALVCWRRYVSKTKASLQSWFPSAFQSSESAKIGKQSDEPRKMKPKALSDQEVSSGSTAEEISRSAGGGTVSMDTTSMETPPVETHPVENGFGPGYIRR